LPNVLVTGATGHLGSHLIPRLIEGGYKVIAVGKNYRRLTNLKTQYPVVDTIACDLVNGSQVASINVGELDSIVHLAGLVPKKLLADDMGTNQNVLSAINTLAYFGKKASRICIASTVGVYGNTIDLPIDESHYINPISYYAASKFTTELYANVFSKNNKKNCTILRFSNVYGEGETINRAIPNFIKSVLSKEAPVVYGDAMRDYTYVGDAVSAIILALESQHNGTFNIASGVGTKIRDIAKIICEIDGGHFEPIYCEGDNSRRVYDITAARDYLKYNPKMEIIDGIRREYQWLKHSILT
jgi:UDP-glucose 4-epimerase